MSPSKKYIADLTEKSGPSALKLKVVQKWRPKCSPTKKKYQTYVMQDEKGHKINATVFDEDVDMYDKVVQQHKEYEITNAKLVPVKEEFRRSPGELQMRFTSNTIIRPLFSDAEGQNSINYIELAAIEPDFDAKILHDVLGVVLYLEPKRVVPRRDGSGDVDVRELVIMDHSVKQPVIVTIWGDLAGDGCDKLSSIIPSNKVIGITSLRVSNYKGFSLATSLSTEFLFDPCGEKADALTQWAIANVSILTSKTTAIRDARLSKIHPKMLKIADLNQKKEDDIVVDEKVWLHGHVAQLDIQGLWLYLGCDSCGQKTGLQSGETFTCTSNYCKGKQRVSGPRMILAFQFTDESAMVKLSAYTDDAQKILGTTAEHLYTMSSEEREKFISEKAGELVSKEFYVEVAPALGMVMSNMLRWMLKRVSFELPQGL